jgi:hypothetical protein
MKKIVFLAAWLYCSCTNLDKKIISEAENLVSITITEYSIEKDTPCSEQLNQLLLSEKASPYSLATITYHNNTKNKIWVFAEKKFGVLFYQSSLVKDLSKTDQLLSSNLGNVFSNCKVEIPANSSKCFFSYLIPKHKDAVYQELKIDYLIDTVSIELISKSVKCLRN